ncbi:MAG: zinc ribbon domain-containing protein [Planctomycetaceae bacterium]
MPIFEYSCKKCDSEFELLVRGSEKAKCPDCNSGSLEKLISAAAGRVSGGQLPITSPGACPPSDAPPCNPGCCRL